MSPSCQRLTLRWVWRTISIIDSIGFVEDSVLASRPVIPSRISVSVSAKPSLSDAAASGQERSRSAASAVSRVSAGEQIEHVAFLVPVTAMHQRALAEHVLDRPSERFAAVQDEQDRLPGIQAAVNEVGQQR